MIDVVSKFVEALDRINWAEETDVGNNLHEDVPRTSPHKVFGHILRGYIQKIT
jgi:hypothetical protein